MQNTIIIDNKEIGCSRPVFIIAEAGVNHNGNLETAKNLVIEAKRAGADCIKFQTFKAERVVTEKAPKACYQLEVTDPKQSQLEMLQELELEAEAHKELMKLCRQENITFLSTPYNIEDIDFLEELGVSAFKFASMHIFEPCLLQYAAAKGKPLILSTGMADMAQVKSAVDAIRETGNDRFVLLQCTTDYPSRIEDVNMRAMMTMANSLDVPVGYSDHTRGNTACVISVASGACIVEKHFTLNKTLKGPDHLTSADPLEFNELVRSIREAEMIMGSAEKKPCDREKENAREMCRSIVAKQKIPAGETITRDMVTFKRPSNGIKPVDIDKLVGQVSRCNIQKSEVLHWDLFN